MHSGSEEKAQLQAELRRRLRAGQVVPAAGGEEAKRGFGKESSGLG